MIALSDYREEDFCVRFTLTSSDNIPFTLRSDYIESDPMIHLRDFIEHVDILQHEIPSISIKMFEKQRGECIRLSGDGCDITYLEDEFKDSCVAEVFVTNVYLLLLGVIGQ